MFLRMRSVYFINNKFSNRSFEPTFKDTGLNRYKVDAVVHCAIRRDFSNSRTDYLDPLALDIDFNGKVLKEYKIFVKPNSIFNIRSRRTSVHLKSAELDELQVRVLGPRNNEALGNLRCSVERNVKDGRDVISVTYDDTFEDKLSVCSKPANSHGTSLQLHIPHQSDVNIETCTDCDVSLDPIELQDVSCSQQSGTLTATKLKCSNLLVRNHQRGNIDLTGSFVGNLDVKLFGVGSVLGDLLRCSSVNLTVNDGSVDIKAVYSPIMTIALKAGDVRLKTIRADCSIALQRGDLVIGCMDGRLNANVKTGNAAVFANHLDPDSLTSIVCQSGQIKLAISPDIKSDLKLEGRDIDVSHLSTISGVQTYESQRVKSLQGRLNNESDSKPKGSISAVFASAKNGAVVVRAQNWFQTITSDWK